MHILEIGMTAEVKKQNSQIVLSELTPAHYKLIHEVKEYWINMAIKGGGENFTVEDIRDDINWLYKAVGDMKTDKPLIFLFDSYASFQLGYNLLRLAAEDNTGILNKKGNKNILENAAMDRMYDLLWFGQNGQSIHEAMDVKVKREVQEKIWEGTARNAGDGVGMGVWDVVRQNLQNGIQDVLWINLFKNIAIPGAKAIRSKVTEQVWEDALGQLAQYTGHEVGERVTRELEAAIEAAISNYGGGNKKLQFVDHFVGAGNWVGWMSFYDFFVQAGILKEGDGLPEEWVRWRRLLTRGIWTMACYEDCILICKLPTRVRRDEVQKQLHSLAGPAVEWPDGTGQYFIYGINFSESFTDNLGTPPPLWNKLYTGEITWADLFAIRNIEQRRVAIRVYGPERIMRDAKAELIDRSERGNELYRINAQVAVRGANGKITFKPDDRRIQTDENHTLIPEMRVMHYKDPSTDRWYYSFVPTNINKANEGMAWKFQIPVKDYENELKVEA
jgi:hypothetical protein